jgi:hypothetical protein
MKPPAPGIVACFHRHRAARTPGVRPSHAAGTGDRREGRRARVHETQGCIPQPLHVHEPVCPAEGPGHASPAIPRHDDRLLRGDGCHRRPQSRHAPLARGYAGPAARLPPVATPLLLVGAEIERESFNHASLLGMGWSPLPGVKPSWTKMNR